MPEDRRTNIVLIGMPGAGKSTVGVLLAKTMKRSFLDTDLLIQTEEDRYLRDIIAMEGLDAFLDVEARVICGLAVRGYVIATGGSVIYRQAAMEHLRAHGTLVYLSLPLDVIEQRIRNITTRGIAKRPEQSLHDLYAERCPLYRQYADLVIDAEGLTPEETVNMLVARLRPCNPG
ncbi:MAG: shikimate kinase [Armatimonadota bacterium]